MTAALPPPLPQPALARWQPLRMGIVELYHYDCEEFWFRDGHLLLRGNNGTGKSKVLSLTLPFLLDADMSSARIEPDGDRGKRMEWNLLMGGRHERRTGYVWIEFGRVDAGEARYLTLGCGLAALAGRSRIDSWHFITDQRAGEELHLITPERAVLTRERLTEAVGNRGRVFETARDYRRAVDERLFQLGEERYRALMDTLINLRQPQLSKRPDEETLSNALTDALPPLAQSALEDVAEAMTQLDEDRDALLAQEALRGAVAQFGRRYRAYAGVNARREARRLRQAQTDFDNASRVVNDARARREAAQAAMGEHEIRHRQLESTLERERVALEELRRDPAMRDAERLHAAERAADERLRDATLAAAQLDAATRSEERERATATARRDESGRSGDRLAQGHVDSASLARSVGIAPQHEAAAAVLVPLEGVVDRSPDDIDRMDRELRGARQRRREQIGRIRQDLVQVGRCVMDRDVASATRNECAEALESARGRAEQATRSLDQTVQGFLRQWADYLAGLKELALPEAEADLDELAAWAESLSGVHPLAGPMARAHAQRNSALADEEARIKLEIEALRSDLRDLAGERQRLLEGDDRAPAAPYTRDPAARAPDRGEPLWHMVDFHADVPPEARAGLEAALEAAGLLDAWIASDGMLRDPHTRDTLLVPREPRPSSLSQWLAPVANSTVNTDAVEAILACIECMPEDSGAAEAWVSPDGRFRLGPAKGAWGKPAAEYIGYAAREAARRRRLEELATEIAALDAHLAGDLERLDEVVARRSELEGEIARAPKDEALRHAHSDLSGAETVRREAQERLAGAEARWNQVEIRWRNALEALERNGRDLRLPMGREELDEIESKLSEYAESAVVLSQAAREHRRALLELSRQEERQEEARARSAACLEESRRREREAGLAEARRDELRQTVGAAVSEIERRLAGKEESVRAGESALREEGDRRLAARDELARSEQKEEDAALALEGQQQRRQEAIEHLRAFTHTGLMAVALPELDVLSTAAAWTIDPALTLARRAEQALAEIPAEDGDWTRVQSDISRDFNTLTQAMSAQGHQAHAETSDFGMIVRIVYQNRPESPHVLARRLDVEIAQRREILTAREREVLENHLQAEVAAGLQKLLQAAERRVQTINAELSRRATSTGVRFKLEWTPLPEGENGAPVGLAAARTRLLNTAADAWSAEDRKVVGEFLRNRISMERSRDDGGSLLEHLSRALDYRRWHRFRVKRYQDGAWRPLSGPASSGERALGLTVPLFAAVSSHYTSTDHPLAPRLVLLDEAFAGIDDEARAHCMALIREFDLDFVMTSEREWGCYAELPGLAICHLVRREGVDAVFVSRWSWDGKVRRQEADPSRRYPQQALAVS